MRHVQKPITDHLKKRVSHQTDSLLKKLLLSVASRDPNGKLNVKKDAV